MSTKSANNYYPLLGLLKERWSPRSFAETPVENEKLCSLFEAARWSASAMNEQPWRFIIGQKGESTWDKIFECLVEWNQNWAKFAPVLVLTIGRNNYSASDEPNEYYRYDTGQSVAHLSVQAMELGLYIHQMAGFDANIARSEFKIPGDFTPVTALAIGYPGDPGILAETYFKREISQRDRNDFSNFVFGEEFGKPSSLFINKK